MRAFSSAAAISALCLVLASCGGGGSDSTPAPSTSTTSPSPVPPGSSGGTYPAGSPQGSAFAQLNSARSLCGFGAMAQASELDTSAAAHANYMALNNAYGHSEVQGKPGFTGVLFSDRETAAGYRWNFAGEALAQVPGGSGADAVRELLAAPYHAALLLNSFHDVGLGWSVVGGFNTLTMDLGSRSGQPGPVPSGVVSYPCNGVADAVAVGSAETPSPFPANPSASWGQPVIVRGPADLALTSATITGPAGPVTIQAIYGQGQSADPNNTGDFTGGWFAIIPVPLQPNTSYSVAIAYTSGGSAGRLNFTFTTAAR